MTFFRCSTAILAAILLTGCAYLIPDAQRIQLQQGNRLSYADIQRLHTGQTRAEVRELIGGPILSSPFRADRWDYVYYRGDAGRSVKEVQRLTLLFDQRNRVSSIIDRYQPPDGPVPKNDDQPLPENEKPLPAGSGTGSGYPDPG